MTRRFGHKPSKAPSQKRFYTDKSGKVHPMKRLQNGLDTRWAATVEQPNGTHVTMFVYAPTHTEAVREARRLTKGKIVSVRKQ